MTDEQYIFSGAPWSPVEGNTLEVKVDPGTGLIILATPVPGVGVGDGVTLGEGLIDGLGVGGVGVGLRAA